MKNFIIGIISWLPRDERRTKRQNHVIKTVERCKKLFKNIPIVIVAQDWDDFTIEGVDIKSYDRLGIVGARKTLQEELLKYDFDYAILLDDDATIYGNESKKFLEHFNEYEDGYCFRPYRDFTPVLKDRYMPAALNLCVISKTILQEVAINVEVDPEKLSGYEDYIYPLILYKKYPEKEIKYPIGTIFTSFKTGQNIVSTWDIDKDRKTIWENTLKIIKYVDKYAAYPEFTQDEKTKKITILGQEEEE